MRLLISMIALVILSPSIQAQSAPSPTPSEAVDLAMIQMQLRQINENMKSLSAVHQGIQRDMSSLDKRVSKLEQSLNQGQEKRPTVTDDGEIRYVPCPVKGAGASRASRASARWLSPWHLALRPLTIWRARPSTTPGKQLWAG